MKIIKIDQSNAKDFTVELIPLISDQMKAIGSPKSNQDILNSLKNAFLIGKRAMIFLSKNDNNLATGFSFFNICSGLESGGDYIWINEIYVHPNYRQREIGNRLVSEIEMFARENGFSCLLGVTWEENKASKKLFNKSGFESSNLVWLAKSMD